MNISRIFRLSFIFVLMLFFVIVSQYYVNYKKNLIQLNNELKIAIFIKDDVEKTQEEIFDALKELNYLNVVEYVDSQTAFDKAVELNPELLEIFSQEEIHYPAYVLANRPKVKNIKNLEDIKTEIKLLDFVEDVAYDKKAYSLFFDNLNLFLKYKKILICLFVFGFIIFLAKLMWFCLKRSFKDILTELLFGFLISVISYVVICLFAVIGKNPILVLDWQILYLIVPLGMIISFVAKETNA